MQYASSLRVMSFTFKSVSLLSAALALLLFLPGFASFLVWVAKICLLGSLSLVLCNLAVLYIYTRYVVRDDKRLTNEFPPLAFVHTPAWSALLQQRVRDNQPYPHPPLLSSPSEQEEGDEDYKGFDDLVSYILRDFIDYWFVHVGGPAETSFRHSVDHILRSGATTLKRRLQDADLFQILVSRLIPRLTAHISDFREAEIALRGRSLERSVTQSDELDLLLASQFRSGHLHPALTTAAMTTKPTETSYLRHVVDRVLPYAVPPENCRSKPVKIMIRELVSCAVLQPVMDMLADPDFWNQTIDTYLGKAIREQRMVRKLREALNRHAVELDDDLNDIVDPITTTSAPPSGKKRQLFPSSSLSSIFYGDDPEADGKKPAGLSIKVSRRTFQEFLRMIEEEKSLLELKRVRNDIVTQLRKKRVQIQDREPEEIVDGEKVEDTIVYINRLSVAKKRADKRIAFLTGEHYESSRPHLFSTRRKRSEMQLQQPLGHSLQDILTNAAGLSYFMEFMDRRGDMVKLQFYLTVNGFETSTEEGKPSSDRTFLDDVTMVYSMYFAEHAPHRLPVEDALVRDLRQAIDEAQRLTDADEFHGAVQKARRQLYDLQHHILRQIEKEHFSYFKHSDLYFKYLASTPNAAPETPAAAQPVVSAGGERRSLDETTLYRTELERSPPINNRERIASHPMERTVSARQTLRAKWSETEKRADSDTEVVRVRDEPPVPLVQASTTMEPSSSSQQQQQRPVSRRQRGHVRAASEHAPAGFSRLLGLGKIKYDWFGDKGSTASVDSEELDDDEADEDDLSRSTTTLEEAPKKRPSQQLLRNNTVDAVEAELQSILDGADKAEEKQQPQQQSSLDAHARSVPSTPTHPRSPLLLGGLKGTKSTMALPVQDDSILPSWSSSGGPNGLGQIEHDSFEVPRRKARSERQLSSRPQGDENDKDIHLAPPGDLMLATKIKKLSEELDKLMQQEAIVDVLIQKAEAKEKLEEIRILKKSKSMMHRELQQIQYQKSQYELQESENVLLPDRTKVSITSSTIGSDGSGDFALYVIEIQQLAPDGNFSSGWIVARRYSEFFALHQTLKHKHPIVRLFDFPSKWPLLKLHKAFVEARRTSLERYLQHLLAEQRICESAELRAFLSQQNIYVPGPSRLEERARDDSESSSRLRRQLQPSSSTSTLASKTPSLKSLNEVSRKPSTGFMRHIYRTVAEGIDDMFIGPSMLDLITQRMGEQVIDFFQEVPQQQQENLDLAPELPSDTFRAVEPEGITRFTEPLCDLFVEMFELKEKNNWLRRQAVVIILQQILGGTIERKLRETVQYLCTRPMVGFYFDKICNSLWPKGQSLTFKPARTADEKQQTREAANRKLSEWLPDMLGQMVGRQNARRGARRLFTVLQNKRLNQDLLYTLLDEAILALFPELEPSHHKSPL
ncbi:PXA domain-domain-containing protein [Syncephalastrum racemosum]|uniref:PXA domain-domain-containing protein n=1 Tax=Syncephalastrum racemosum TaxID=13706 RepID=A0A1X2HDS5_SYNRA|nr:PXA domain-domain-containing protein [Syncephalastrum racemosum]